MNKKFMVILLILVLAFSAIPVSAANYTNDKNVIQMDHRSVIYKASYNITENGGTFKIGFVEVKFPKNFIEDSRLPIVINVEIYAENGIAYIEFNPDILLFNKDVLIKADNYDGLLYDKATGKNIQVHIKNQVLKVKHFSRYAFS